MYDVLFVGCCLLFVGCWLLVVDVRLLFVVHYSLRVGFCLMFVVRF